MKIYRTAGILCMLLIGSATFGSANAAPLDPDTFRSATVKTKVHTWWHWISGNVTKEGIVKDLDSMKRQGVSQATILNVGGFVSARLDVPNIKFGTPQWYDMFRFSLEQAKQRGITIGVHNCDGWSTSGGPWITPDDSMKEFVWSKTNVRGGQSVKVDLQQPPTVLDYYRDVAVLAYPNRHQRNSYVESTPAVMIGKTPVATKWSDGNPLTKVCLDTGSSATIAFETPFQADHLFIMPHLVFSWDRVHEIPMKFSLSSSTDGKRFSELKTFTTEGVNIPHRLEFPKTRAKFFKLTSIENKERCEIAEFELLLGDESPSHQTGIHGLLQKTAAVKNSNDDLYAPSPASDQATIGTDEILDIADSMDENGRLNWSAPEGEWTVLRFGYTTNGFKNKPATPEGEGLEVDKMDPAAVKVHFDGFSAKLVDKAGDLTGSTFKFLLIDSWECRFQNWTGAFPEEFQNRRGYDLRRWIPVLCGEVVQSKELSDGFLHDFRKTIADLIDENYYKAFADLCHADNLELHAEAIYGGGAYPPLDILRANKRADLPMLEFWARHDNETKLQGFQPLSKPRQYLPAASSLIYDKPVIGSEAYTSRAYYSESPPSLKRHGDDAFCSGVNQMILHSYVHQPFDKQPGVTLGQFGAHFNRNNPWWNVSSDWMTYQARAQYLLQQGEPVVDCIFYMGDRLPQDRQHRFLKDLPFGIRASPCNFDVLSSRAEVYDGKLSLGGRQKFALLILPENDAIELATLAKIESLVRDGLVVYGSRPKRLLGAVEFLQNQEEFEDRVATLWGEGESENGDRKVGKGRVIWGSNLRDVVTKDLELQPDFGTIQATPNEVKYIHKQTSEEDIYFVFNQTDEVIHTELLFRVTDAKPEIWQAVTGEVKDQPIYTSDDHHTRIPFTFGPSESYFVVFPDSGETRHITEVVKGDQTLFPRDGKIDIPLPLARYADGDIQFKSDSSGSYEFVLDDGTSIERSLPEPTIIDLSQAKIELAFEPIYQATIDPITLESLISITENENPAIQHFAGTLKYRISFRIPEAQLSRAQSVVLNMGEFDAAGTVTLNGKPQGKIWTHAMQIPIDEVVQIENILEIRLATTCRNRLLGDLKEFGEIKTVWTTAPTVERKMLDASMPLKPSGLMGPLTVTIY